MPTPRQPQTEWVLCSDDWQDIVIIYIPQLNDTPIEDNYGDISLKKNKKAYFKYSGQKRSCQKQSKLLSFTIRKVIP